MTEVHYTSTGRPPLWREVYRGGSPEAEQEHFRQLAGTIVDVQLSHARNADQFVAVAQIGAGPPQEVQPRLLAEFGPAETRRIVDNLRQANRPSASLALESYWSRS